MTPHGSRVDPPASRRGPAWLRRPGLRAVVIIAALFLLAAAAYWFLGNYIDPAGTVLLTFAGLYIAFGFAVLLRDSWAER